MTINQARTIVYQEIEKLHAEFPILEKENFIHVIKFIEDDGAFKYSLDVVLHGEAKSRNLPMRVELELPKEVLLEYSQETLRRRMQVLKGGVLKFFLRKKLGNEYFTLMSHLDIGAGRTNAIFEAFEMNTSDKAFQHWYANFYNKKTSNDIGVQAYNQGLLLLIQAIKDEHFPEDLLDQTIETINNYGTIQNS